MKIIYTCTLTLIDELENSEVDTVYDVEEITESIIHDMEDGLTEKGKVIVENDKIQISGIPFNKLSEGQKRNCYESYVNGEDAEYMTYEEWYAKNINNIDMGAETLYKISMSKTEEKKNDKA